MSRQKAWRWRSRMRGSSTSCHFDEGDRERILQFFQEGMLSLDSCVEWGTPTRYMHGHCISVLPAATLERLGLSFSETGTAVKCEEGVLYTTTTVEATAWRYPYLLSADVGGVMWIGGPPLKALSYIASLDDGRQEGQTLPKKGERNAAEGGSAWRASVLLVLCSSRRR